MLKEIQDRFEYEFNEWKNNYDQGDEDMRYVAGDPWEPDERKARKDLGRPCLSLDELGQYINQRINDIRQNKRAIKLQPAGDGANDKTAELRADIIRTIESKGGIQAYITGYENAVQRGLGFWAVSKRYVSETSFDQELYIRSIPNAKTCYVDSNAKEPACADMRYAFIVDDIPKSEFKKRWKKAKQVDFSSEYTLSLEHWIKENTIQVAEYWTVESEKSKLYLIGDKANPQEVLEVDLKKMNMKLGDGGVITPAGTLPIIKERMSEKRKVWQYITNGVEILERNDWEGRWIPIIPCFGRQYWIDKGAGSKRVVESMIRKARDAQMLHNYVATAKMEAIGQILKAPYIGYEGQFDGHEDEWSMANRTPMAYLLVKPILDATGQAVLPPPQRNQWDPAIQGYEITDESAKRSIQNAMGMYNVSVGRQDTKAESGVAIRELDLQSDQGGYHFIDNFDTAIQHTGRILDEMIPHIYDTQRELLLRKPDDTSNTVRINESYTNEKGELVEYRTDRGRHDVTISTGPSYQSQREMAEKTADLLIGTPQFAPLIIDLAIKMKQLGPLGDQMAERLTPPQFAEKQSPAQLNAKLQEATQLIQALTKQLNTVTEERDSKVREMESKERIAALKSQTDITTTGMKLKGAAAIEQVRQQMAQLQTMIDALLGAEELMQKDKAAVQASTKQSQTESRT